MKRKRVDEASVVPLMVPATSATWLPDVKRKAFPDDNGGYQRYCSIIDDDIGQPADSAVDVVNNFDDIFEQEGLWKGDGGYFSTADDQSVIGTALARFSMIITT